MIKQLLCRKNLNRAYLQVYRNKGVAGVDGVSVRELSKHLQTHAKLYLQQIEQGSYRASPIMGLEIPKSNGRTRLLGIPIVVDSVFQQALHQVLQPIFERDFQAHSYEFRPNRNAHQAIAQSLENINAGYQDIVDIDLLSFFDEVEYYVLFELIFKKVKCAKTLKLLRSFLRAPIWINGKLQKRRKGVPQGSPLSPLLSNILLNELDKALEKRGHRYVLYSDDFSIYVRSKTAAKRVGNSIYKINLLIRGWNNYFKLTSIKSLGEWLRNRLRYCILHDWKKRERKRKNLIRLGVSQEQAYAWRRTRKGG